MKEVLLMDEVALGRALVRIAHEIIENNNGTKNLCIVGIRSRGVPIARRIAGIIERSENCAVPIGILDIGYYRDDTNSEELLTIENKTDIPFDVTDKYIVLVDDVLYTGRTARAAMDAIMDMGRAKKIRLAVLVDRGHRELPICADFVGKNVPTSHAEHVGVRLSELDGTDRVVLCREA